MVYDIGHQDGKRTRQEVVFDLDLCHVDSTDDPLGADSLGDAGPASVDETHDVATFGGRLNRSNKVG